MGITNGDHLICIWMNLVTASQGWIDDVGTVGLRKKGSSWDQVWTQPQEAEQLDEWRCHLGGSRNSMGTAQRPGNLRMKLPQQHSSCYLWEPKADLGDKPRAPASQVVKLWGRLWGTPALQAWLAWKKAHSLQLRAATLLQLLPFFLQRQRGLAFIKHSSCALSSQELLLHPTTE